MSKPDKAPIGDAPCPIKGCAEVVPVFKYEGASDPARRRFAGRMFCRCPTHGRVENQEYLLENIVWRDASSDAKKPVNHASNASPASTQVTPASKPAAPTKPARAPTPAPASKPEPEPEPERAKKSDWFPEFFK